jgi:hypothetical protein
MVLMDGRAAAFQMIGTFYPFSICSLALLASGTCPGRLADPPTTSAHWRMGMVALAVACIALRVPRLIGSARRYASQRVPAECNYSKRDIDRLADRIGGRPVEVNITGVNRTYFLLVEFGRRNIPLQWSPQAWNDLLGENTGWPAPTYATPAPLQLIFPQSSTPALAKTSQYQLVERATVHSLSGPTR